MNIRRKEFKEMKYIKRSKIGREKEKKKRKRSPSTILNLN